MLLWRKSSQSAAMIGNCSRKRGMENIKSFQNLQSAIYHHKKRLAFFRWNTISNFYFVEWKWMQGVCLLLCILHCSRNSHDIPTGRYAVIMSKNVCGDLEGKNNWKFFIIKMILINFLFFSFLIFFFFII